MKFQIYLKKGIGNSDGSDFSMLAYLNNKQVATNCSLSTNTNCNVNFKPNYSKKAFIY